MLCLNEIVLRSIASVKIIFRSRVSCGDKALTAFCEHSGLKRDSGRYVSRRRLALVTGGASGIGEATCLALAGEGATLVVADKQLEAAQKVTETLSGDAKHHAMYVDVADSASVDQLFSNVERTLSQPLSIVVNCAGVFRAAPFVECSDELFDEVIRVNLRGTFLVTRAAARHMVKAGKALPDGGAAIVNVASILAKCGWPDGAAYCASKAAVVALTKSAAQELAAHGVRCNVGAPRHDGNAYDHCRTRRNQGPGSRGDAAEEVCPAGRDRRGHQVPVPTGC
ncbi:hypothetical protein HPB49_004253 [Dermacentor silvarum]|uniref:Uncharacterized protein n=1 Tax=Dermacentor silvarum TaxID=543639 RepID=A0ACB8DUS2_DERSI|nr:hypothetical protein HPB49_004253 [Dermacentor silvarum]